MVGNGHKIEVKPIAMLSCTAEGKLIIDTEIKDMIVLAKWMAQAVNSVVKQIPVGEKQHIIVPKVEVGIDRKPQ